jgi:hypothetical protein
MLDLVFVKQRSPVLLGADAPDCEHRVTSPFVPVLTPVRTERILRIQGYTDLSRVRPAIRKAAEWAAETIAQIATPTVTFKRLGLIQRGDDRIELSDGTTFDGAVLPHELACCDEVVVFVQSLGDGPDSKVIGLLQDGENLLEALLLETAGWLALEEAIRQFRGLLRREADARGRALRKRLGPGYTYYLPQGRAIWPLYDQRSLFAVFGGIELPVRLLESCAMQPKLSRSGLFGERPIGCDDFLQINGDLPSSENR